MDAILLSARLILAAVFLVAGLVKLADREGSREAVSAFGVHDRLVRLVAGLLPPAEVAAAVLLVPSVTARAGAGLAALLLVGFCAGIARSIVRGEAPDCHCFGQLHSSPAGPWTLARNVVLAALAGVAVVGGPGLSATGWVARLSGTGLTVLVTAVLLAGVLGACAAFALALLRQHGQLLLRVDALEQALGVVHSEPEPEPAAGLPIGSPAPRFSLSDLRHRRVGLEELTRPGQPVLLLFTDPGCGPCSALMPEVAGWQAEHSEALRIVLVSRGGRDANRAHADEHGLADVLVQRDREVSERYLVNGTPSAVLVAGDGTIASGLAEGADAIEALVEDLVATPALEVHQVAAAAPELTLRTLDGEERALAELLSGPTVVLFWNPDCGFCERMLDDVLRWEASAPDDAPALVLVSTGDAESNREMGLRSPILLDDSFAAGDAFGASGTPSAVLVDRSGRIASPLAVGAPSVLALMGADEALVS